MFVRVTSANLQVAAAGFSASEAQRLFAADGVMPSDPSRYRIFAMPVTAPYFGAPIPIRINSRYLVWNNHFVVNVKMSAS
jgi:hypothetical protein